LRCSGAPRVPNRPFTEGKAHGSCVPRRDLARYRQCAARHDSNGRSRAAGANAASTTSSMYRCYFVKAATPISTSRDRRSVISLTAKNPGIPGERPTRRTGQSSSTTFPEGGWSVIWKCGAPMAAWATAAGVPDVRVDCYDGHQPRRPRGKSSSTGMPGNAGARDEVPRWASRQDQGRYLSSCQGVSGAGEFGLEARGRIDQSRP